MPQSQLELGISAKPTSDLRIKAQVFISVPVTGGQPLIQGRNAFTSGMTPPSKPRECKSYRRNEHGVFASINVITLINKVSRVKRTDWFTFRIEP